MAALQVPKEKRGLARLGSGIEVASAEPFQALESACMSHPVFLPQAG
jgi:hypothetical protein